MGWVAGELSPGAVCQARPRHLMWQLVLVTAYICQHADGRGRCCRAMRVRTAATHPRRLARRRAISRQRMAACDEGFE